MTEEQSRRAYWEDFVSRAQADENMRGLVNHFYELCDSVGAVEAHVWLSELKDQGVDTNLLFNAALGYSILETAKQFGQSEPNESMVALAIWTYGGIEIEFEDDDGEEDDEPEN